MTLFIVELHQEYDSEHREQSYHCQETQTLRIKILARIVFGWKAENASPWKLHLLDIVMFQSCSAGVGLRKVDQQYPMATNQLEDDGMQQLSFLALYERFREFNILNKKAELAAEHLCFENYFVGISLMLFYF